jgi:hypothetical protein
MITFKMRIKEELKIGDTATNICYPQPGIKNELERQMLQVRRMKHELKMQISARYDG